MHSRVAGMGWIEVICGCMFSGKTEELIRRMGRLVIAREMVRDPGPRPMFQVFKNALDTRCPANEVGSHDGKTTPAVSVANVADLWRLVAPNTDVVAIDEAQFFGPDLVLVCQRLADAGVRVIASGLDTDFRGEPFGPMPGLLAIAREVTKLQAVCAVCGGPATRSQRLLNGHPANYDDPVIMVGAEESYEARCRHCHEVPGKLGGGEDEST